VGVDADRFIRDGYLAVRGAFDAPVAAACREAVREALRGQGIDPADRATWPPVAQIASLDGEPFAAAGTSPTLTAAYDELIGRGRWTRPVPGRASGGGEVPVAGPGERRRASPTALGAARGRSRAGT
jgi:hypothetical protein